MNRILLAALLCPAFSPLLAQQLPSTSPTPPSPSATLAAYEHERDAPRAAAVRVTIPIRVDGVLDEAAWQSAQPITEFTQVAPQEGQPASERTDVRVLYDQEAIYIGAWLYDREAVRARVGRRDMSMSASDWLTVIIDARHDHRTSFGFEVNPAGARRDQTRAGFSEDDSWDPVWEAKTSVSDSGWVAEIRIPFSQLRFSGAQTQTWGMQVERQIARIQEFSVWAYTPPDQPGGAPRYGHLIGLSQIPTENRLELMPYVVTRAEYIDRGDNPFRSNREYDVDAGADLKFRLTSSLTLDATVNPDFGQVEVDPAVINLTAFETFFPEKRPFFIEGSELFNFADDGSNSVFYSRRIGRQPSLAPAYAARDVPSETRILGATKLTGRTAGGWAMGVLDAVTSRENARFRTPDGDVGETAAEPLTNYFVGRVRREMREAQTAVGGFFGAVNRSLDTDELSSALRSAAYSGGVDLLHQWSQRTVTLEGFLAGSHVQGESGVIAATQRLPYHYFQRPDADHLDYDTTRTSLTGFAGSLSIAKQAGRHWHGNARVNTMSPGYEVSDLGFQRRADRLDLETMISFNETRPRGMVRRHSAYLIGLVEHNYGKENVSNRIFSGVFGQFMNYWRVNTNFQWSLAGTVDDRLTRGGPAARRPGNVSGFVSVSSDPRSRLVGSLGTSVQSGGGGHSFDVFPSLSIRPAPHWEVSLSPSYSRSSSRAQYLQRVSDTAATRTFGSRYVFAELDQSVFSLNTRVNFTFTPALSLQVFAQPFIASGDYGPPMEFAAPGRYEFLVYGDDIGEVADGRVYPTGQRPGAVSFALPAPDFNFRSLRGNAVLRWEWRPGSTLYLAWQQTRSDFHPIGDFDFSRDFDAIFATSPDNILLMKVSYWFNP
ncbi:MAG: carbohydrate binding family 9 domain-containing protein [Gemmatimonadota bacterium]|nr:carbohydrate binding family 9 domain-containing protein [Gemmatimonadota bacterium]